MKIRKKEKLTVSQRKFVEDLKHSLAEVELHLQGKIQLKGAYDLLEELQK